MKKLSKTHLLIIIAIIIILLFTRSNFNLSNDNNTQANISKVCVKKKCFSVELVKTQGEKEKGLMFRESLDKDNGMLFVYNVPEKSSFWMKNTLIPLDIIWINKDSKIVYIVTAYPCKKDPCNIYSPDEEALYVLEINAGLTNEYNIKDGNVVVIS